MEKHGWKIPVVAAALVIVFGIYKTIDRICTDTALTKGQAESRAGVLMRQPSECFGNTADDTKELSKGWQCVSGDRTRYVSCIGTDCYLVK